jgi:hypothetical protein
MPNYIFDKTIIRFQIIIHTKKSSWVVDLSYSNDFMEFAHILLNSDIFKYINRLNNECWLNINFVLGWFI